ncbi:MAG: hypothetical protein ACREDR_14000 [Blastocatellia bacterium]
MSISFYLQQEINELASQLAEWQMRGGERNGSARPEATLTHFIPPNHNT